MSIEFVVCDLVALEVAETLATIEDSEPRHVAGLSLVASPDFAAYAEGRTSSPRCVLCQAQPCACPPFGSPEYFVLLDRRHGR